MPTSTFRHTGRQNSDTMAFKDSDIRAHVRSTFGCGGVANYARVDEHGRRDEHGVGVEGHMAKLRRENDEKFSLAHVARGSYRSRLRWSK